jgi:basic amino acid/polyamine antiporter, APA family
LFGTFKAIVAAAAFTILIYYSIANLAALRMRNEDKLFPNWIPVLGFIFCILLALTMPIKVIGTGLGLLAAGFVWRVIYKRLINAG